ncbi:PEP-CTERM sorting domain-containing protein [Kiritimatiellaeota bacterium B1221]|nr:PEP-CTERM sorting domain-containing protein [Kiritimatiellaeota bacterium B1221]
MKIKFLIPFLISSLLITGIQAATKTWDGSENPDYSWTKDDNWVGGAAPANADYGDFAEFTDTYFGSKTANVDGNLKVQGIIFDNSVGWSITGSQLTLRTIESSGVGTNIMNLVKTYNGNNVWTIGAGNTLEINNLYVDNVNSLTLTGGGTLDMNNAIGGWSSNRSVIINDATLKVASTFALASHGTVYMNDASGLMQLNDTVANVTARIGSSIIDNTALGLVVTDMGGGVSQVSVIPEPSTAVLLFISGLTILSVVRKRK